MDESPRSNRPTPRTPAAIEAELRRRVRLDLQHARSEAENGDVDDVTLAEIIARAIATALGWHQESPAHTRNATTSSRSWRPAGGPRGGPPRDREFDDGPRRPREFDDGPRRPPPPPPRDYDDRPRRPPFRSREYDEGYQDEESRPPPRGRAGPPRYPQRGPRPGGRRPPMGRGGGGGFGSRKPRRGG